MKRDLRKILYPLSLIYGLITFIRNLLYDLGLLNSNEFDLPVIAVGNLNVGGTGKSPQIESLIRLLGPNHKVAVLSRGYGRKTKGFVLADSKSDSDSIGDEPFQFFKKFPDLVVAVDENRSRGIENLLEIRPDLELILLDDAFQHRRVKAGMYLLLTAYDDLYSNDLLLPAGNLRESKNGAGRADIIIVTKCPENLNVEERKEKEKVLRLKSGQHLFFSAIKYSNKLGGGSRIIGLQDLRSYEVLLVTGIANPDPLIKFLEANKVRFDHLRFRDHHKLSSHEVKNVLSRYQNINQDKKIILTTEKDYVRNFLGRSEVHYLPIETEIIGDSDKFEDLIRNYVQKK